MKSDWMTGVLSCQEHDDLLDDALDGTLTRFQRAQVWLHRRLCAGCRRYAAQYVAAVEAVRGAFGETMTEEPLSDATIERLSAGARRGRAGLGST